MKGKEICVCLVEVDSVCVVVWGSWWNLKDFIYMICEGVVIMGERGGKVGVVELWGLGCLWVFKWGCEGGVIGLKWEGWEVWKVEV